MLFNSLEFLFLFLPLVLAGYALALRAGRRPALAWLLAASLLFYGWWNPAYLLLLAGSILVNYGFGLLLARNRAPLLLALGIAANLAPLAYYKYTAFLSDTLGGVGFAPFAPEKLVLPLAISFFTFQQIGYLVDVFRGKLQPPPFLSYALFVAFFPQLIAGPIVRSDEMLPQYRGSLGKLRAENAAIGLTLLTLGLAKKVIVADTCAGYAEPFFALAAQGTPVSFLEAWPGTLWFGLQIYFDFSGYSTMAVGLACLFGFRLPLNFLSPYKATSVIEFWRRWHITLSRFLRDYLYVPLGGNRHGRGRQYLNIMIVMLLGGLWHGAGWTFVIWGGLHGLYLVVNHAWRAATARGQPKRQDPSAVASIASWSLTFLAVTVAWVFFRAPDLATALNVLTAMSGASGRLLLPDTYAGYAPFLVPLVEALGGAFVPWVDRSFLGLEELMPLALVLVIVLLLPAAEQWLFRWHPTLEPLPPPKPPFGGRLAWRPTAAVALALSLLAMASLGLLTAPLRFVYFEF